MYTWIAEADPPHDIGRKPKAAVRIKPRYRLHHPCVALANVLADRQTVATVAHGDFGHEPQVGGDKLMGGLHIVTVAPPARKLKLLFGGQDGEPLDLSEISRELAV